MLKPVLFKNTDYRKKIKCQHSPFKVDGELSSLTIWLDIEGIHIKCILCKKKIIWQMRGIPKEVKDA